MELSLRSYAKINLSLDITGILPDGYHGVETVMQAVSLYDTVNLSFTEGGDDFAVKLSNNRGLPNDERNLAYKAAILMQKRSGKKGVLAIDIEKKIPIAAGLAGGSSNAAAVIVGLNSLFRMNLKVRELCSIAEELGSDIPFLVLVTGTKYKTALGYNKGEKLEPIKSRFRSHILLVKPPFGVSTKEVYQGMDEIKDYAHPSKDALIDCLIKGDRRKAFSYMGNVLENYTLKAYIEVGKVKEYLKGTEGADFVLMSGSGPTVIGFYDSYELCRKNALLLREKGYEAYYVETLSYGKKGDM
ncbi:MAG: 4-(cytidine 5'-diphospho)-2-C-methyl-D-erythritol kinase [Clostridia bacterium]|nr:4-(cytidine 5'-diphospho)-2-C-methyl-D-erythritol kinase [Clostridia bacterium]